MVVNLSGFFNLKGYNTRLSLYYWLLNVDILNVQLFYSIKAGMSTFQVFINLKGYDTRLSLYYWLLNVDILNVQLFYSIKTGGQPFRFFST